MNHQQLQSSIWLAILASSKSLGIESFCPGLTCGPLSESVRRIKCFDEVSLGHMLTLVARE